MMVLLANAAYAATESVLSGFPLFGAVAAVVVAVFVAWALLSMEPENRNILILAVTIIIVLVVCVGAGWIVTMGGPINTATW